METGPFLGFQVQTDHFRLTLAQRRDPDEKIQSVFIVSGIQAGVSQVHVHEHAVGLVLPADQRVVQRGVVIPKVYQVIIGEPGIILRRVVGAQRLTYTGIIIQSRLEIPAGALILPGFEGVFSGVEQREREIGSV